jgi:hypothetical protein
MLCELPALSSLHLTQHSCAPLPQAQAAPAVLQLLQCPGRHATDITTLELQEIPARIMVKEDTLLSSA